MDIWHVTGGNRLEGSCKVQGSKNASLPMLAAAVACPTVTELENVPRLSDTRYALEILRKLGCSAQQLENCAYIDSRGTIAPNIPQELMHRMRSSIIFLGALLTRCGEAELYHPGGCRLGERPIDIHISALQQMGVIIEESGDSLYCLARNMHGAELTLPFPSVGATENIMLAALGAKGETVIHNAAREPEIVALQEHLRAMGADISGAGTPDIRVSSFSPVGYVRSRVIPDRIAASTIACAVAAAGGDVELCGVNSGNIYPLDLFLKEAGCDIITNTQTFRVVSAGKTNNIPCLETGPYPEFPTDAQPLLMAALLRAEGTSIIKESVFQNRFLHVPELRKTGADISVNGKAASINGVDALTGAKMTATDLRGGAAMIIAALSAEGESIILDNGHISRGYERLDATLRSLGAKIELNNK